MTGMLCAFHIPVRPRSANKQPNAAYTARIAKAAREEYAGPLVSTSLYSRIIWFHKYQTREGDADNIAKRVHDALKGVLFSDDRIVTRTLAMRIDATEPVFILPDMHNPGPATRLADALADPQTRDILYIEVGVQSSSSITLGPVQ